MRMTNTASFALIVGLVWHMKIGTATVLHLPSGHFVENADAWLSCGRLAV